MSVPQIIMYKSPGRPWGMPDLSPFCAKLETYLRMAGWDYQLAPVDFRRAPKGKVPYVAIDGELLGDSQFIIETLEKRRTTALDASLTLEQRAQGHALRRMLDEGLYFVLVHERWSDDTGWKLYRPVFGTVMPAPLRLILPLIRRSVRKSLKAQGTGRHSATEVTQMGIADFNALSAVLGGRDYLLGNTPSTYDASAFAFIHGIAAVPHDSPLRRHLLGSKNLMHYRDRVLQRWFPELSGPAL